MNRLRKVVSNIDDAKVILERVKNASNDLKDIYYILFDNLSVLFDSYPELYKQINMTVKLPSNEDALKISQFNNDLDDILEHFQDDQYLSEYVEKKE